MLGALCHQGPTEPCSCGGSCARAKPKEDVSASRQSTPDSSRLWDVSVRNLLRAQLDKSIQHSVGGIYLYF